MINGSGSSNGSGTDYGVLVNGNVTAGASVTITGKGQGGGTNDFGAEVAATITAGSSGSITLLASAVQTAQVLVFRGPVR